MRLMTTLRLPYCIVWQLVHQRYRRRHCQQYTLRKSKQPSLVFDHSIRQARGQRRARNNARRSRVDRNQQDTVFSRARALSETRFYIVDRARALSETRFYAVDRARLLRATPGMLSCLAVDFDRCGSPKSRDARHQKCCRPGTCCRRTCWFLSLTGTKMTAFAL